MYAGKFYSKTRSTCSSTPGMIEAHFYCIKSSWTNLVACLNLVFGDADINFKSYSYWRIIANSEILLTDFDKKAFDCLDHQELLSKLKYYGVACSAQCFLKSYLNKREKFVCIKMVGLTKYITEKYEVPQGSVLGPL